MFTLQKTIRLIFATSALCITTAHAMEQRPRDAQAIEMAALVPNRAPEPIAALPAEHGLQAEPIRPDVAAPARLVEPDADEQMHAVDAALHEAEHAGRDEGQIDQAVLIAQHNRHPNQYPRVQQIQAEIHQQDRAEAGLLGCLCHLNFEEKSKLVMGGCTILVATTLLILDKCNVLHL